MIRITGTNLSWFFGGKFLVKVTVMEYVEYDKLKKTERTKGEKGEEEWKKEMKNVDRYFSPIEI